MISDLCVECLSVALWHAGATFDGSAWPATHYAEISTLIGSQSHSVTVMLPVYSGSKAAWIRLW